MRSYSLFNLREKYLVVLSRFNQVFLTLSIALLGSLLFSLLSLPLPWLLGALFTSTISTFSGLKLWVPNWLRANSLLVLGALFGTSVSPDFIENTSQWIGSIISVILYVILVIPPLIYYYIKLAHLDFKTAYFSSAPGGLIPMTVLGGEMGADVRTITLIQSSRIILTVAIIPFAFAIFGGYEPTGKIGTGGSFANLNFLDGISLLLISIIGYMIARPLKIPSPSLMGPLAAVALFSTMGELNNVEVPDILVATAQCIIGASIGAMFNDVQPKLVAKVLFHGSVTSIIMIVFGFFCAYLTHTILGLPLNALILGFAPGGFPEMVLVGFALGVDITFLVAHQLSRYLFVTIFVPISIKAIKK